MLKNKSNKGSGIIISSLPGSEELSPRSRGEWMLQAFRWMRDGQQAGDVIEALAAEGLENPQELVVQALEAFAVAAQRPKEVETGKLLEKLEDLYRRMLAAGDFGGALGAVREMARINESNTAQMSVGEYFGRLKG